MLLEQISHIDCKVLVATLSPGDGLTIPGQVRLEVESRRGVFWPADQTLLDKSYPKGTLSVQGVSIAIPISGIQKCKADLAAHWDFDLSQTK